MHIIRLNMETAGSLSVTGATAEYCMRNGIDAEQFKGEKFVLEVYNTDKATNDQMMAAVLEDVYKSNINFVEIRAMAERQTQGT